jgi:hypothetical protein
MRKWIKKEFYDMKKTGLTFLLILVFILSACGSSPSTSTTGAAASTQAGTGVQSTTDGILNTSYDNAVSIEQQLILGTFKLEGSDQALTADQAKVLLPLWQQVQALSPSMGPGPGATSQVGIAATPTAQASGSDSQTQIDALVTQIEAAMTTGQLQAIADMQITQDAVMTILQDQGISMGGPGGQAGNGQQPPQGTPPASGPNNTTGNNGTGAPAGNGQTPQGTPPAGGPNDANGNNAQSTPQAAPSGQANFMPPQLIDALLQLLQNRIAGTTGQTSTTASTTLVSHAPSTGTSNTTSSSSTTSAAYTLDGGADTQSGQAYSAANTDESAVYVNNGGNLTLTDSTVTTTGNTSSTDNSSFHGLNAGVLAANSSTLSMSSSQVTTSGTGANGVFSTDSGSTVTLSNVKITATGDGGHAVMATQGGTMVLTDVDMSTAGASASAIATDRGGGTITVTGGTVKTSGTNSAGIYSTGDITVTGTTFTSTGAEAAVIEGGNSITLTDVNLTSNKTGKWGVMIYQSMSGDAQGTQGTFTMTGGSLVYTATDGPLFYVNNSTAVILLKGVNLTAASGTLVKAAAGSWGNSGSNGGTVLLTADGQVLAGNLVADNISSITLTLQNGSTLNGAINTEKTAKTANLSMDATSTWTVTADSYLAGLSDANGISGSTITNIIGHGHTVYYDASLVANSSLGGKTYSLAGGGTLKPVD